MHDVVNGYSSQTPFHYSRNEYGHEGAHGTVVSRLTHACVYSCVHVSCVPCAFVHECDISVLSMQCSWVVCVCARVVEHGRFGGSLQQKD